MIQPHTVCSDVIRWSSVSIFSGGIQVKTWGHQDNKGQCVYTPCPQTNGKEWLYVERYFLIIGT